MGAMICLEYDDRQFSDQQIMPLAEKTRLIVREITDIKDVFVYANSARIKVAVAPVEIFIHINAKKLTEPDQLVDQISHKLKEWKEANNFVQLLNVTVIPAAWHFKLGV